MSRARRRPGRMATCLSVYTKFCTPSVLNKLGIPPCRAIYVGDQLTDADAARAAGVAFGAVCWGYGAPQALARAAPEAMFETVDALRLLARSTQPDARFLKAQPGIDG